jgi:hypothetical protein
MQISMTKLSNSVLGSLADQTITISKKATNKVVENHPLLNTLEAQFSNFKAVFGKQIFSGMGTSVENADFMRDSSFIGLKTMLMGMTKLPPFANQQIAVDLFRVFQNRGLDINNYSYNDQTTEMDKLITDLSLPENLSKLTTLNLSIYFDAMKQTQNNFKTIYAEQLLANSNLRLSLSASSIRRNIEDALRNYLSIVEGMKSVTGWTELHAELNELVKSIRNSKIGTRTETPAAPTV